jgi:aspartate oxidase
MKRIPFPVRGRPFAVAAALACAMGLPAAWAADTGAKAPARTATTKPANAKAVEAPVGKGSGPVLSLEELRRCMTEDDRLKKETADILETQKEMQKTRSDIDRLGAEIEAEKATVDRTSQAAVDAYNEKLRTRGKLVEDYKAAAPLFNERVDKLAAGQQSYAKDCGDRRYLESDYDDIKAGK